MMTAEEGEQFMVWAHEKSKVVEGGKMKGLSIASGFTNSQKLSWMNRLLIAGETESDNRIAEAVYEHFRTVVPHTDEDIQRFESIHRRLIE